MLPDQRESRTPMIEPDRGLPRARLMATLAVVAQCAGMRIVGFVASDAFGRRASEDIGLAMTAGTFRRSVLAQQWEARLAVIELRFFPTVLGMAVTASGAHRAFMRIVLAMAAHAIRPEFDFAGRTRMAGVAARERVLTAQREIGRAVIERALLPVGHRMAFRAILAQRALVAIVLGVASDTGRRRAAEFRTRRMAACAKRDFMRPDQRVIGQIVAERLLIEHDDRGVAPLMIGMAIPTRRRGVAAVVPALRAKVGADVLVAGHA